MVSYPWIVNVGQGILNISVVVEMSRHQGRGGVKRERKRKGTMDRKRGEKKRGLRTKGEGKE